MLELLCKRGAGMFLIDGRRMQLLPQTALLGRDSEYLSLQFVFLVLRKI